MLNPVIYTEKVIGDFLKYQLTSFRFADADLQAQLKKLISADDIRKTPLFKGPYVSLSRAFKSGDSVSELIGRGEMHGDFEKLRITKHPALFRHQSDAWQSIRARHSTIITTGTGSGKTESFLYPIIQHCLELRDQNAAPAVVAILVYPMNALLEDQMTRLREMLGFTGVTFGAYTGQTPEKEQTVYPSMSQDRAGFLHEIEQARNPGNGLQPYEVHPPEEMTSREAIRKTPPRILLTNPKQLELLLTRSRDLQIFTGSALKYLVVDEAHTQSGVDGAETATLLRRLRALCGKSAAETVCIATSATFSGKENDIKDFGSRFFGIAPDSIRWVSESYEEENWQRQRTKPVPAHDAGELLARLMALSDSENPYPTVLSVLQRLTGENLDPDSWQSDLYAKLSGNEITYQLAAQLKKPRELKALLAEMAQAIGRELTAEELLCYLSLGSQAIRQGRPLLRPVFHGFVTGISGVVATFEADGSPTLFMSGVDAHRERPGRHPLHTLTCRGCGQHYFEHFAEDFHYDSNEGPTGGQAHQGTVIYKASEAARGGFRLVLTNAIKGDADPDVDESTRMTEVHYCVACGAIHLDARSHCLACEKPGTLLRMIVFQTKTQPGYLSSCVVCSRKGKGFRGTYREPAGPVRGVVVADVHVLAQNLQQYGERQQLPDGRLSEPRLLVFTDNRQDAAFQAGWMADHARRLRLHSLTYDLLKKNSTDQGILLTDLCHALTDFFAANRADAESLLPEIFRLEDNPGSLRHIDLRRRYLKYYLLRVVSDSFKQKTGLEAWGRIQIRYEGIVPGQPQLQRMAATYGLNPNDLSFGVEALLDVVRRKQIIFDSETQAYTRFWRERSEDIRNSFFNYQPHLPVVLKLQKTQSDSPHVKGWLGRSNSTFVNLIAKWGLADTQQESFLNDLWQLLINSGLLTQVNVLTESGQHPNGFSGQLFQLNLDKIRIVEHRGLYRCNVCGAGLLRQPPNSTCTQYRCTGTVAWTDDDADNYDLARLDQDLVILKPEEHSAQVRAADREKYEQQFKDPGGNVNCLVCTPTLELGVDIGALDTVLMRNIPPTPANYWQRAGRAGRRFRLAVNLSYARRANHDQAYFRHPEKILMGEIEAPKFNLRNEVLIRKHVHASILTILNIAVSEAGDTVGRSLLDQLLPTQISEYLFADNEIRSEPADVSGFNQLIATYRAKLLQRLSAIFTETWPQADDASVSAEILTSMLGGFVGEFQKVIGSVYDRVRWAMDQINRYNQLQQRQGVLSYEDQQHRQRLEKYIARVKGQTVRSKNQAAGYDDNYTYAVLAAEGFLPGYGLGEGSILASAQTDSRQNTRSFDIRRPPAIALREFAPGNMIYANHFRFRPDRLRHHISDPLQFFVDVERGEITESNPNRTGFADIAGVEINDLDLALLRFIDDDEEFRFQMPVTVLGYEKNVHEGGHIYHWGAAKLDHRRAVQLRLVNVAASQNISPMTQDLGYPVCTVCGKVNTPFATPDKLAEFSERHQETCGKPASRIALSADIVADCLTLYDLTDQTDAYSLAEALRIGASIRLQMDLDDLDILVFPEPGSDKFRALIYDPMPGGSGLISQMKEDWAGILDEAKGVLMQCASDCETSCEDCMHTYYNSWYQKFLNRHRVLELLEQLGSNLQANAEILPVRRVVTRNSDARHLDLRASLSGWFKSCELTNYETNKMVSPGPGIPAVKVDFFFTSPHESANGICVLVADGANSRLSEKSELENETYRVFIANMQNLSDSDGIVRFVANVAQAAQNRGRAEAIRTNRDWLG